ncbi:VWA domain-containing protein [Limibacter armeniacum]|uniref:vWA domain-containing protein n=1 Tax=Limibacter armeniacum TaxID=466084 RepID=UPI002FE52DC6
MTFGRDFGILEVTLIVLFGVLYLGYLMRVQFVNKAMKGKGNAVAYKLLLRTTYFALLIFALLGPSFGEMKREVKSVGKDIYLCVDLSKSMDATDIQPSRLSKVKFEMKNLIQSFSSDRIGLIVFTNDAFLQCPLTYDGNALNMFIETMSTGLISSAGTDFAPPLEMALEKLNDAEEGLPPTKAQAKIIVLISDGEDFGETTDAALSKIKSENIKLFTLGVGTESGGKIPHGYRFKRDKNGNDVLTQLNEQSLQKLADMTDGKYFEISDQRNDINRMISAINNIEGEMRGSKKVDAVNNKYYYFLALAILLMIIDVLFTVKVVKLN